MKCSCTRNTRQETESKQTLVNNLIFLVPDAKQMLMTFDRIAEEQLIAQNRKSTAFEYVSMLISYIYLSKGCSFVATKYA